MRVEVLWRESHLQDTINIVHPVYVGSTPLRIHCRNGVHRHDPRPLVSGLRTLSTVAFCRGSSDWHHRRLRCRTRARLSHSRRRPRRSLRHRRSPAHSTPGRLIDFWLIGAPRAGPDAHTRWRYRSHADLLIKSNVRVHGDTHCRVPTQQSRYSCLAAMAQGVRTHTSNTMHENGCTS